VVRLPCMIWVNSGSVFILANQQRNFNGSTCICAVQLLIRAVTWTHCKREVPILPALDAWINLSFREKTDPVLPARTYATDALLRSRHYGQFRIILLDFALNHYFVAEQMFVPFLITDSNCAPSKRWCVGFAMCHGETRSAGKGKSS
jgi:hypothetical protein